jgi:hypothetical protein
MTFFLPEGRGLTLDEDWYASGCGISATLFGTILQSFSLRTIPCKKMFCTAAECVVKVNLFRSVVVLSWPEKDSRKFRKLMYYSTSLNPLHILRFLNKSLQFCFMAQQPLVGQVLFIIEASRSHSDTPVSAGLLWTSDQLVAETYILQNSKLTRDRHPCPRPDSNPQSQQASGRGPRLKSRGHWDRHKSLQYRYEVRGSDCKSIVCILVLSPVLCFGIRKH